MVSHIGMLLTSWAIVADVWYLPPEQQQEGESSIAYANRIKALIAQQGGLVDLEWYVSAYSCCTHLCPHYTRQIYVFSFNSAQS